MSETDLLVAVSEVRSAAEYLRGPRFEAMLAEALKDAANGAVSKWVDRRGAAAYCMCSMSEVDRAASKGIIKRYLRGKTPLFCREELDAAISEGRWRRE